MRSEKEDGQQRHSAESPHRVIHAGHESGKDHSHLLGDKLSSDSTFVAPTDEELHDPAWQDSNLEKITLVSILRNEVLVRWYADLPECEAKGLAIGNLRKLIEERSKTRPDTYRIGMFSNRAMQYCAEAKAYVPPPPPPPPAP